MGSTVAPEGTAKGDRLREYYCTDDHLTTQLQPFISLSDWIFKKWKRHWKDIYSYQVADLHKAM